MAAYLAHEDWQPFADRIRPIEPDCSYIQYRWTPSGTTCLGVDKYENSIKQVTYNSGTTWQNVSPAEYSATTLIEANSYDCGYRTRTTSSATYCDGDDLYVDVYSQVSEDGGTTWTTTATTKTLVEAGGCAIEPQYRTLTTATTCVNVDKYVLAEYQVSYDEGETWTTTGTSATTLIESNSYDCGYRTRETSGSAYCNGVDKYIDVYSEYSEDSGSTWQTASTTPTLVESNSYDCGYRTRTLNTATTCVNVDKYTLEEYQVSTDSGSTWTTTGTSATTLIEANSYDCGYRTRTTSSATYCDGDDLYVDVYDQVSEDSGTTWTTTATTKTLVEAGACATVAAINYIASRKLDVNKFNFTPTATTETYDSTTSAGTIEFNAHVTAIGNYAFTTKTNLISITIPNGVTSIGEAAFLGCSSLSNAIVPNSVTSIGNGAFTNCSNLQSITIPSGVTSIGNHTFDRCSSLQSITIPDGVTSIGEYAFSSCSGLTSIEIPSGVTSIGTYAFSSCSGLTSITVNATTPPTLGEYAFSITNNAPILVPCDSLSLYESAWSDYASRLQVIPGSCSQAFKYKLTLNDTSIVSANCDSTSSITQSEISAYTATCSSVEIGNCVTSIDYAGFYGCAATSITIGNNVTTIGSMAFGNCFYIASLVIPDSVTSIGNSAFSQSLNLTGCTLSNNLTSIGRSAFQTCNKLVEISIPSSVTNIGDYAFSSCSGLTSVTVNATTPPALGDYAFDNRNYPIYVPAESVETFKQATGWRTYANRIQAIPNS